jgi:hypothetical protein
MLLLFRKILKTNFFQQMDNAHERRWPPGLLTLETRQMNRRQYEQVSDKLDRFFKSRIDLVLPIYQESI